MSSENLRREAITYVEAVVARAEGAPAPETVGGEQRRPLAARLLPGALKRAFVRFVVFAFRHPFDHLSHPLEVEFEHQVAELRASVHAANRRADQAYHAMQRMRPELESWRRATNAALSELEGEVRSLRDRLDALERR